MLPWFCLLILTFTPGPTASERATDGDTDRERGEDEPSSSGVIANRGLGPLGRVGNLKGKLMESGALNMLTKIVEMVDDSAHPRSKIKHGGLGHEVLNKLEKWNAFKRGVEMFMGPEKGTLKDYLHGKKSVHRKGLVDPDPEMDSRGDVQTDAKDPGLDPAEASVQSESSAEQGHVDDHTGSRKARDPGDAPTHPDSPGPRFAPEFRKNGRRKARDTYHLMVPGSFQPAAPGFRFEPEVMKRSGGRGRKTGDSHVCRTVCSHCARVTTKSLSALCGRHCEEGGRAFTVCLTFWNIREEHGLGRA